MYFKIALGNVKKSFKEYAIYFLTLTLAVSIFYSFNSIESQKAFTQLQGNNNEVIKILNKVIGYVSVFVSIILVGLIVYANNFLIKKRKKELGIYMILGMNKNKISKILVMEISIVGVISLGLGLLLGIIESQGLSIFTSKLFEIKMSEYRFVISIIAICKTIIYFGIINLLTMIFNTSIISKYKIIDLLKSDKKNEKMNFKSSFVYVITFILSFLCIIIAYNFILQSGFNIRDKRFTLSLILGTVGTVLFFFSLCGAGLYIVKKNKKIYFKNINIFTVKQLNSKIKTNFISMSVICLMLFVTIEVLSIGLSFKDAFQSGLKETTPFDVSGIMHISSDDKIKSIEESLNNVGFKFDNDDEYVFYDIYEGNTRIYEVLSDNISKKNIKLLSKEPNSKVEIIKLSDYNDILKLRDKEELELNKDEIIITSNYKNVEIPINEFLEKNKKIVINNKEYKIKNDKAVNVQFSTSLVKDNPFTIIINDEDIKELEVLQSNFNVNYGINNKITSEEKYKNLFEGYSAGRFGNGIENFITGETKEDMCTSTIGLTNIMLFVGIYIGIIFLISSMTVLALQQLSEASDSIERYKALRKIGVSKKSIEKSIFHQTLIYFSLPIFLALIHSIVGIKAINNFIELYNKPGIGVASMMTVLIFLMLYIAYFYATYVGYKNIVNSSLDK
ncbi:FtsX-like permease family protein [Clostridium gasigenes]|uniref:ABC transporter permease n=1 Tax=Clostridium gasigenes TaxID=94869 RepID=UPI0014386AE0|nr:FtsX-like permease family protein [Clostridium gasigenes]NKF05761.1 FtsX-like permease family protein [Clostridium gasigenes]QSW19505.1 FtsX-like permease family protein [Clostridium gasigenes]